MVRYRTFKRSARNFDEFARASKRTVSTGLTYEQAQAECKAWNNMRTPAQVRKGTKLELEQE